MSSYDRHIHDCDCCKFAGSFPHGEQQIDVYDHQGQTLIMRHGSRGEEYSSFPIEVARFIATDSKLWSAGVALFDLGREPLG